MFRASCYSSTAKPSVELAGPSVEPTENGTETHSERIVEAPVGGHSRTLAHSTRASPVTPRSVVGTEPRKAVDLPQSSLRVFTDAGLAAE